MKRMDYKEQLITYFKKNLSKGYPPEALTLALVNQGYSRTSVDQALNQANKELAEKAPEFKEKPVITYEVIDEDDNPIILKKSRWKKFWGLFR